jgi:hypothetical protein
MLSSAVWRRVAIVRTDVSKESVKKCKSEGFPVLKMEEIHTSETSVFATPTWRRIPEGFILETYFYLFGL